MRKATEHTGRQPLALSANNLRHGQAYSRKLPGSFRLVNLGQTHLPASPARSDVPSRGLSARLEQTVPKRLFQYGTAVIWSPYRKNATNQVVCGVYMSSRNVPHETTDL